MTKLYDVIEMVIDNPEKYIGRRSVQRLYAFLGGYLEGHPEANDNCLKGFNEYVEEHYLIRASLNWADLIAFKAVGDYEEIELFKKHFRDFIAAKGKVCEKEGGQLPQLPTKNTALYDLITTILKRPELYIGKCSVQRLYAFLNGFLFKNEAGNDHCLDGFDQYVAVLHSGTAGHNWADIIELFSSNDHSEMEVFKRHFDKYAEMTHEEFLALLGEKQFNTQRTSLDLVSRDGYGVRKNGLCWEVFAKEQETEYVLKEFPSENEALQYLFHELPQGRT